MWLAIFSALGCACAFTSSLRFFDLLSNPVVTISLVAYDKSCPYVIRTFTKPQAQLGCQLYPNVVATAGSDVVPVIA
jgi:hypothetical protein